MQGITQGSRCPTWTVHGPGNFRSSRPLSFYLVLDEICLFLNYAYAGIQRMQRGGSGPRGSLGNEGVLTQPPPSYACGHAGSHRIQESRRFPVGNADRQPRRGTIAEPLSVVPLYPEPQSSTRNFNGCLQPLIEVLTGTKSRAIRRRFGTQIFNRCQFHCFAIRCARTIHTMEIPAGAVGDHSTMFRGELRVSKLNYWTLYIPIRKYWALIFVFILLEQKYA